MIALDLQISLFVLIVTIVIVFICWWVIKERRSAWRSLPVGLGWRVCETMPVGIVVVQPGETIAFMNTAARRLLSQLGSGSSGDLHEVLEQFTHAGAKDVIQSSGLIHQPIFVRWWRYLLDEEESLLVLAEGADQQRLVRQQAFIGQLVHELRTPLTAITAHAEIAGNAQSGEALRLASVQTVQNEAQRMGRFVRDMLELHRLETTDDQPMRAINLVLVAEEAIAQVILRAEELGIKLSFHTTTALPSVLGQPDRLKQVFINLLDNAIKYSRGGDEIQVRLDGEAEGVICIVKDNGPGIAPDALPHVTERLYRARTDVEGNGIGLALVSEILRRHNTTLMIESSTEGVSTGTTCRWMLHYVPTLGNKLSQ